MTNYKLTTRAIKDKDGNKIGEKKCIIVDTEKITQAEQKIVDMYIRSGEYQVFPKKAPKKAGKGLTKAKMEKYLQDNDKEGLRELQAKIKQKENFMKIMTWFKSKYPNYEEIA